MIRCVRGIMGMAEIDSGNQVTQRIGEIQIGALDSFARGNGGRRMAHEDVADALGGSTEAALNAIGDVEDLLVASCRNHYFVYRHGDASIAG